MTVFPDVKCPQCRQKGNWLAEEWGPFCSKRCKMVDLGKWFEESNKISEPLSAEHFLEEEEEKN